MVPRSHAARVAGRSAASTSAMVSRYVAAVRDRRSASPISSAGSSLYREGVSHQVGWESSAGRRRANSASSAA